MKIQKKTGIDSLKLLREALQKAGSTYIPNADYRTIKNATEDKIEDISSIVDDPNETLSVFMKKYKLHDDTALNLIRDYHKQIIDL